MEEWKNQQGIGTTLINLKENQRIIGVKSTQGEKSKSFEDDEDDEERT